MSVEVFDFGESYADRYQVIFRHEKHAELWNMSADAHMPNGVCYFAGRDRRDFRPERAAVVDSVPLGVLRAAVRVAQGEMHGK